MSVDYSFLMDCLQAEARSYVERHVLPGPLLAAVARNDLQAAVAVGLEIDSEAGIDGLWVMARAARFFRTEAPPECSGSAQAVTDWLGGAS